MAEAQLDAQGRPIPQAVLDNGMAYPLNPNMEGQPGYAAVDHSTEVDAPPSPGGTIAEGMCLDVQQQMKNEFLSDRDLNLAEQEHLRGIKPGYLTEDIQKTVWKLNDDRRPIGESSYSLPENVRIGNVMTDEEREGFERERAELKELVEGQNKQISALTDLVKQVVGDRAEPAAAASAKETEVQVQPENETTGEAETAQKTSASRRHRPNSGSKAK